MSIDLPEISDQEVHALVAEINSLGVAVIAGYLSDEILAHMRQFVDSALKRSGGEYVSFNGNEAIDGTIFEDVGRNFAFKALMSRIYAASKSKTMPPLIFYPVVRCLSGKTAAKHSLNFHYDSYVLTALLPVQIPTEGKTGDLIMLPNTRKIRVSYLANVLDKLLLDNRATQMLLALLLKRKLLGFRRIHLVPGNIYFFWGYRTIHTNEACDEDRVRATALYHYVNPHAGSTFGRFLRPKRRPSLPAV